MAESKFLRWQDKNGDNLIDICEIDLPRAEKVCLDCIPNPRAIVQKWRKRTLNNPFLNGKLCKYQITNVTEYTDTGGQGLEGKAAKEALDERYEEYAKETVEALLNYHNKDTSDESINKILEVLEYTDYDLAARPLSHLKLLYSVPFSDLNNIDEAPAEEEEEPAGEDITTTYIPSHLIPNMIRVRKGLHLYASNLRVYRALDGKNLLFEDGSVFNLDLYGDFVLWGTSITEGIIPDISDFFRTKGLYLGSFSTFFPWNESITKFECTFTPEYKVKQVKAWTEACGDKPLVFKGKKLKSLNSMASFKDPTAMAYFAKVDDMERDLTARRPKLWIDFVQDYTYPKIVESVTAMPGDLDPAEAALSCIGDALAGRGKQLGQDILDDVFSIGDALAAQFHKMLCEEDYTEALKQEFLLGKHNKDAESKAEARKEQDEKRKNIKIAAAEQAFGELEERDVLMTNMCARLMMVCGGGGSQAGLDKLWLHGLDPLRLCGLFDMMLDAIQCLFKGLTFEEVLNSMIKSALKAMDIKNFGDLFIGLPPDKQAKLDDLVQRKLANGDLVGPGRVQDTSEDADPEDAQFFASGKGFFGTMLGTEFEKPWENQELIDRQKQENMVEGPYEGMSPTGIPPKSPHSNLGKATAAAQIENAGAGLSPNVIMEAYILALIEEYSDNLLALLAEIEKFPGAQIIAFLIAGLDCPRPPLFDPSIVDFLKEIELPFCRNTNHIGLPRMENIFAWIPKLWDIFRLLWFLFRILLYQLVWKIVCKLMVFVCELLGDAICKALEVAGQMAASLPAVMGGRTTFSEVIKDSICGPDADQDQIEGTIEEMFDSLGAGSAALADKSLVMNFAEDLSSTTTRSELTNAILGNPSQSFLEIIDSLVEFEYPEFADAFGNPTKAAKFFENIGNVMPAEAKAAMKDFAGQMEQDNREPANPSLCATPQDIEQFCETRASLLEGRASPEQIALLCATGRDTLKDDLEEIGNIIQNGIPDYFEKNMPPIMSSDPTCDNGLIPFEPKEIAKGTTTALNSALEVLKVAYSQDMLGNGPFVQSNWGFMNMVLSDTMGWAYTTHLRKSNASGGWFTKKDYVDFTVASEAYPGATVLEPTLTAAAAASALTIMAPALLPAVTGPGVPNVAVATAAALQGPAITGLVASGMTMFLASQMGSPYKRTSQQHGAFPIYVAEYLASLNGRVGEMERAIEDSSFNSNNEYEDDESWSRSFEALGFDTMFDEIDLLILPDYGYNVKVKTKLNHDDFKKGRVVFTRKGRKGTPDIKLKYRDNAQGDKAALASGFSASEDDSFSYGFNVGLHLSDLVSAKEYVPIPREFFPDTGPSRSRALLVTSAEEAREVSEIFEQVWLQAQVDAQTAGFTTAGTFQTVAKNRPDDNARIVIEKVLNYGVMEDDNSEYESDVELFNEKEASRTTNNIITYLAYEFLSTDNAFDDDELDEYIKFRSALEAPSTGEIPQLILLKEIIEKQNDSSPIPSQLKATHDDFTNRIFSKFANEIYTNEAAFEYGAQLDELTPEQIEYGMEYNGQFVLFKDYLDVTDTKWREAPLGISRMQYDEENNDGPPNRVFYLDPLVYGGSNVNPPVHLKPSAKTGWLGMVDVMFPQLSPCKPKSTDLVDFGSIQDIIDESYSKIPEDERLKSAPDCAIEKPYNRILERASKAGIEGLIHAMCRIFVSVNFLKSLATFTKFYPDFKNNFSSLYASYVVELMEEELKDAQPNSFIEFFSPFKDDEFWYAFLEQAVQTYARKVEDGAIEDVPADVLRALQELEDYQTKYKYPDDKDLEAAKLTGDAWALQTIKNYRYEKNLEAIKKTEEHAKIILKEFVIQEMEFMAEVFMTNLQKVGLIDKESMIKNLGYYVLENLTSNTSLTLSKELKEEVQDLPTEGEGLYTNGNELATPDGEPYSGYYHVHIDEEGDSIYMVGERHTDEAHDALRPFANKIIVPIGSINPISAGTGSTGTAEKPLIAEIYVKINDQYMTPDAAVVKMAAEPDRNLNISEVYPGTMELVIDPESGEVIGTTGILGVRYGLRLSLQAGAKYRITEVEVDALDLPIAEFQPLEADSKLLLCLINNLMDDGKFKMLTSYIFPLKKILSTLAIYNDMAFLPSVGEITTDLDTEDETEKPGKYVLIDRDSGTASVIPGAEGWATKKQRKSGTFEGGGFFTLHFDKWNRSLLVKSKSRVKKLFKDYYNSRDFDPGDMPQASDSFIAQLRAAFSLSPGERHFPWFKKRLLRSNPFNANGELCKKSD